MKVIKIKEEQGITLIALVVTIVVLLILAGVSITTVLGDDGIIQKARQAAQKTEQSMNQELNDLNYVEEYLQEEGQLKTEKAKEIDNIIKQNDNLIELIQTAEGGLSEIHSIINRIMEIVNMVANGKEIEEIDRTALQEELGQLLEEINNVSNNTKYQNENLLNGTYNKGVIIGTDNETMQITIESCNTNYLGLDEIDISTSENASNSIEKLNNAMEKIAESRSYLGAFQNRLDYVKEYYNDIKNVYEQNIENLEEENNKIILVGIKSIQNILERAKALANVSSSESMNNEDRKSLKIEFEQLIFEIDRIANHTKNGNTNLLNGTYNKAINVTLKNLDISEIDINTMENAINATEKIESAIAKVSNLERKIEN